MFVVLGVIGALAAVGLICACGLFLLPLFAVSPALLAPAATAANSAAHRMECTNNLKQIALAMQQYHDRHGTFPPAYIPADDGSPMHSWRALILPFMNDPALPQQYDFSEPWDSPANSALASYQPDYYACPADPAATCSYFVVNVSGSVFDGSDTSQRSDITDGLSNTIMIVEVTGSNAHWLEPTDLGQPALTAPVNSATDGTVISSLHPGGAMIARADGSTVFLAESETLDVLQGLILKNDGEP